MRLGFQLHIRRAGAGCRLGSAWHGRGVRGGAGKADLQLTLEQRDQCSVLCVMDTIARQLYGWWHLDGQKAREFVLAGVNAWPTESPRTGRLHGTCAAATSAHCLRFLENL